MDAQVRRAIDQLAGELRRTQQDLARVRRGQRGPQLAHSSLEPGQSLEVRDGGGATRQWIGWLPDGTVGVITEGGDPVSAPSAPVVTPSLGGLRVTWDGTLSGELALPGDFDHMAVHVSTTSGFEPSAATYVGSIRRAGEGGMLPVVPLPYVEHYVRLVPVTTGGVQGVPSAVVAATPLQVDGADLTAGSVTAPIIAGGAVTADKLEAILVLASTIVAGIPGTARVEMDQDGLRGYNESNELIFAIDSTGNAVFSGDITGSLITGSRMIIGSSPNAQGFIESLGHAAQVRATSPAGPHAQLRATETQAEFSAWGDATDPATPAGGLVAASGICQLSLRSDASDVTTKPVMSLSALTDQTHFSARSGSGSEVLIRALPDHSSILLTAPPATDPDDAQSAGFVFAHRYSSNDIAAVSMQSPEWTSDTGPEYRRRSLIFVEGARSDRPYTRVVHGARRHRFEGENADGVHDSTSDGVVELASTHSMTSPRHRPVQSSFVSQPDFGTIQTFVDFTEAQWPSIPFRTSWSGMTRITIQCAGINNQNNVSSLATGFRISGASTVSASLVRCAYIRSRGTGLSEPMPETAIFYLQLTGNADYTLTPTWRISGGSSATASYYPTLDNTITVEPLT